MLASHLQSACLVFADSETRTGYPSFVPSSTPRERHMPIGSTGDASCYSAQADSETSSRSRGTQLLGQSVGQQRVGGPLFEGTFWKVWSSL